MSGCFERELDFYWEKSSFIISVVLRANKKALNTGYSEPHWTLHWVSEATLDIALKIIIYHEAIKWSFLYFSNKNID